MMVNNSNIDSWEAELNSNKSCRTNCLSLRRNNAFVNHQIKSDKIGEDIIYNTPAKSHQFKSEIRYINPAIYAKSINEEKDNMTQIQSKDNHQQEAGFNKQVTKICHYNSNSSMPNLSLKYSAAKDTTTIAHTDDEMQTGQSTYRCYSTSFPDSTSLPQSSSVHSIISSGTIARVERRCRMANLMDNIDTNEAEKQEKYTSDNRQITRISTTSLSGSSHTNCEKSDRSDHSRKLAHSEWLRKKDEAAQRKKEQEVQAAQKQQEEDEKIARQKEEKALLEKENFLKWIERKKQQELKRKAMLENELELQKHLKEIEEKATVAKALYLHQWAHKKREEQKVRHKEQKLKQKEINDEREKRLEQSTKAYEKWKKNSKNKSKPATQGLLPHQKAKPAYVNPIPWQSIVIVDSDETEEDTFNDRRENTNRLKGNGKETITADQ